MTTYDQAGRTYDDAATTYEGLPRARVKSILIGQPGTYVDVTSRHQWPSLQLEDTAVNVPATARMTLNGTVPALPTVQRRAHVRVVPHSDAPEPDYFNGFVTSRRPGRQPGSHAAPVIDVAASDLTMILDETAVVTENRPIESDRARLSYFLATYGGLHLSRDLTYVTQLNAAMPAQSFVAVTLRKALEMIASQAHADAQFRFDSFGRLHYGASEVNPAPFAIDLDSPGAGEIAPQDLSLQWETLTYVNRVYVQGRTPEGSGWFEDAAAIAANGGQRAETIMQAPDSETAAMALALASMYLGRVADEIPRGSFTTATPHDGWEAGQVLGATSARHGLSADEFRVARVVTSWIGPETRAYSIDFGSGRLGQSSSGRSPTVTVGPAIVGRIGTSADADVTLGNGNLYLDPDGAKVTDGTRVRAIIGHLGGGVYGVRIVAGDGTVLIDGEQIVLTKATGRLPAGVELGRAETNISADGLRVSAAGIDRVIAGRIGTGPDVFGLKVVAPDGATVIIDGMSNVHKIAHQTQVTVNGINGTSASALLADHEVSVRTDLVIGLAAAPVVMAYDDDWYGISGERVPIMGSSFHNMQGNLSTAFEAGRLEDFYTVTSKQNGTTTEIRQKWITRINRSGFSTLRSQIVMKEAAF